MCQGRPARADAGAHALGQTRAQALRVRVGLGREDLEHRRSGRRHRQGVAEERAADRDHVGALAVGALDLRQQTSAMSSRHAPGAERHAAGDRLAAGDEVGLEGPHPGEPTGADHLRVGLVERQQRAGLARERAQRLVEARLGQDQPEVVGQGRLGEDEGDVAALQRPRQRLGVVERARSPSVRRRSSAGRAPRGPARRRSSSSTSVWSKWPVVVAVEHEHLVASGHDPGHADRLGVRLRGRERVLPLRQAVAAAELLGDDDRVLVRAAGTGGRAPCGRETARTSGSGA